MQIRLHNLAVLQRIRRSLIVKIVLHGYVADVAVRTGAESRCCVLFFLCEKFDGAELTGVAETDAGSNRYLRDFRRSKYDQVEIFAVECAHTNRFAMVDSVRDIHAVGIPLIELHDRVLFTANIFFDTYLFDVAVAVEYLDNICWNPLRSGHSGKTDENRRETRVHCYRALFENKCKECGCKECGCKEFAITNRRMKSLSIFYVFFNNTDRIKNG